MVVKFAIFIGLLASFGLTAYSALESYISMRTMVSSSIDKYPEGQDAPEMMICNETGYKIFKKHMTTEEYLENTLKLDDFFVSLNTSLNYSIIPMNTIVKGRCYIIKLDGKMTGDVPIVLKIKTNQALTFNLIHPEQIFEAVSHFYDEQPTFHKLGHGDGWIDIRISKVIKKQEKGACRVYDEDTDRHCKILTYLICS